MKSIITLIAIFTLCSCIEPYTPDLVGYESLLVVDGLITDENSTYTVKLSKTIQDQNAEPVVLSDATVYITDEIDNNSYLTAIGNGRYITDSLGFTGIAGKTYTLHIITSDGNEYESEPCPMNSVPEIDSIYFIRDQEFMNNGTEAQEGIRIILDSKAGENNNYYRWDFEETWKFRVPSPKRFNYLDEETFEPVATINEFCWKSKKSDQLVIHAVYSEQSEPILNIPIFFIPSDKSDRLMVQYSILIRQYSISKKEYFFWNNMKSVNESGNDIFATQPFPVISNIHNIKDSKERVLGYFQVSAVKQKRKNIPFSDIVRLKLPFFHNQLCERIEKSPSDFLFPLTWDEIYEMYCISSDYIFVEPKYNSDNFELDKLVFARPECTDCEFLGTKIKPNFWFDLN